MHVRRGHQVVVLAGEDRGKRGKILKVFPDKGRVIVEGVNFISRHMRPSAGMPQGGIVKKEAPIHASNVMVICPKCNEPTRPTFKSIKDANKTSRKKAQVCKKCGEMIEVTS
ncbi:MAG TPA: 50S ribosomal protein L24 [bacterium]